MLEGALVDRIEAILDDLKGSGLIKTERLIAGPQGGHVAVEEAGGKRDFVNLCANNYLGLADHPGDHCRREGRDGRVRLRHGVGRFICGTQTLHRHLEKAVADYLEKDDAILFAACFDANGGLFEPLLRRRGRRSSPTRSTTPRSSTASGFARRSAIASPTAT